VVFSYYACGNSVCLLFRSSPKVFSSRTPQQECTGTHSLDNMMRKADFIGKRHRYDSSPTLKLTISSI
jgi:hypothetical protein